MLRAWDDCLEQYCSENNPLIFFGRPVVSYHVARFLVVNGCQSFTLNSNLLNSHLLAPLRHHPYKDEPQILVLVDKGSVGVVLREEERNRN